METPCVHPQWRKVVDLGSAASFDFDLGQCPDCGRYVMRVWRAGESGYIVVAEEDARKLQAAESGPERKALVGDWLNHRSGFWDDGR